MSTDHAPTPAEHERLAALLNYGDPYTGSTGATPMARPSSSRRVWARCRRAVRKATDIARNCGLAIRRVERVTEYRVQLKSGLLGGKPTLSDEQLA